MMRVLECTQQVNGITVHTYRDMTEEELAEMERQQAELPAPEPTEEERISQLESENAMLLECVLELSQIVYA